VSIVRPIPMGDQNSEGCQASMTRAEDNLLSISCNDAAKSNHDAPIHHNNPAVPPPATEPKRNDAPHRPPPILDLCAGAGHLNPALASSPPDWATTRFAATVAVPCFWIGFPVSLPPAHVGIFLALLLSLSVSCIFSRRLIFGMGTGFTERSGRFEFSYFLIVLHEVRYRRVWARCWFVLGLLLFVCVSGI